ncbi:MAG: T9SS type B sorting domain-containing protein [Chitinophagaceae bacterium]|nr:MAG: T9SS type B sorting domain-containing protein [Chitinophagaceae bacterium]
MFNLNRITRNLLLLLLFLQPALTLHSQQKVRNGLPPGSDKTTGNGCSNDILLDARRRDPVYVQREEAMNAAIRSATGKSANTPVVLPVVVHIVNNNPLSITDAQVIAGISDLNDAFSKSGIYSASAGADTKISFCLAQRDPEGGNTTGITRTTSFYGNNLNMDNEDARLKNLIQWDPAHYINIWFITSINAEAYANFSCGTWYRLGVGGYATLPPNGGPLDGIVATAWGTLMAHEMGHYLGLYHTFEGGCSNFDCTTNGDRVCDTPPDFSVKPSPSCASPENSCDTDTLSAFSNGFFTSDVPDQISNFMDYGNNACGNEFTQGQADRMHAAVLTQRPGLLVSQCTKPCTEPITAAFTRSDPYPLPGTVINFVNTSTGAANIEWFIDGVSHGNLSTIGSAFTLPGKYKVTLKAWNADPTCFSSYTDYVIVNCGVTARFYTNKKAIASKLGVYTDSILFTNTSVNAVSYQWLVSNNVGMTETVVATSPNLNYVFPTPGNYQVRLVSTNGSCSDTTSFYTVPVADPTADAGIFDVAIRCSSGNQVKVDFCVADYGYASLPKNTPVSFYNNDPRLPGATLLSTYLLPSAVPGGNCYMCFSYTVNVSYYGLPKLFVVFNDAGTPMPILLPNTPLLETNYHNNFASFAPPRTTVSAKICQGLNYSGHTTTGVYVDTFASFFNGCDSIRTLNLTVTPTYNISMGMAICDGQTYAGHTSTGIYVDHYISSLGCDSTVTLDLLVKPRSFTSIAVTLCEGEVYGGHATSGTYVDVFPAANGCDSTRTLMLTVNPVKYTNFYPEICEGQSYFAAGANRTSSGIYRDTLATWLGCDSILVYNLTVHPLPKPDLGPDRGVCIGSALLLNPGSFTGYTWFNAATTPTYATGSLGTYWVEVMDNNGCRNSDTMRLTKIFGLPKNFLPPMDSMCKGNIIQLGVKGFNSYNWSTGATTESINVTETGTYFLTVIDRNGCTGKDSSEAYFFTNCLEIQVPDAFSPNSDGMNEIFTPMVPAPLKDYQLQVFNRWGQKLFDTRDRHRGWDGRVASVPQAAGVYVYLITYKDVTGKPLKKSGTILLVR